MNGPKNPTTASSALANAELQEAAIYCAQAQLLLMRASRRSGGDTFLERLATLNARQVEIIEGLRHRQKPSKLPAESRTSAPLLLPNTVQ